MVLTRLLVLVVAIRMVSTVTIYGGKITATGGKFGAGIGGGGSSYEGGSVSIYGGEVIANGGLGDSYASPVEYEAMGIGRGSYKNGGTPGNNGTLSFLGTNIIYYGDNANSNPTTVIPDNTRYRVYRKQYFTLFFVRCWNPSKSIQCF